MTSLLLVEDLSIVAVLRSERGMSQSQLAEAMGVRATAISRIERGLVKMRPSTAVRLVEAIHHAAPLTDSDAHKLLKCLGLGTSLWERVRKTDSPSTMSAKEARAILVHVLHRVGLETFAALANGVIAEAHDAQVRVVKMVQPPERGEDGKLYQTTVVRPAPDAAHKQSTPARGKRKTS
jgi:transcriptional regulator with XRE-family HTH domain